MNKGSSIAVWQSIFYRKVREMTVEEMVEKDLQKKRKKSVLTVFSHGAVVVEVSRPKATVAWFKSGETTVKRRFVQAGHEDTEEEFQANWNDVMNMLTA